MKTGLNLTFPSRNNPLILTVLSRNSPLFLIENAQIRPDYRRSWRIMCTTVRIVNIVGLSPFCAESEIYIGSYVGLGEKKSGNNGIFLTLM